MFRSTFPDVRNSVLLRTPAGAIVHIEQAVGLRRNLPSAGRPAGVPEEPEIGADLRRRFRGERRLGQRHRNVGDPEEDLEVGSELLRRSCDGK